MASVSCSRQEWKIKQVPEEYRTIYRKLKFIITRKEKRVFLNLLTDRERKEFLKTFWEKRDPDPETTENEFRLEYFARLERATHLFSHEGREGWDTDRGRVFVLLGPPDFTESYPMGYRMYDNPSEVWYYGNFPVIFIDRNRSGSLDLTSLGARYFALLLKVSQTLKPEVSDKKELYGFKLIAEKGSNGDIRLILIFKNKDIYFQEDKYKYYSDLKINLDIRQTDSGENWSVIRKKRLTLYKNDNGKIPVSSKLEVPVNLREGSYEINVRVENHENNITVSRKIKINI